MYISEENWQLIREHLRKILASDYDDYINFEFFLDGVEKEDELVKAMFPGVKHPMCRHWITEPPKQ